MSSRSYMSSLPGRPVAQTLSTNHDTSCCAVVSCARDVSVRNRFPLVSAPRFFFLSSLLAFSAAAQQPEGPITTFKSTTNLVIVNVFVRDRAGNPVEGLKKEDFRLLEDGKAQNISVFEFQKLEDPAPDPPPPKPASLDTRLADPPKTAEPKQPASIKPSKPGEV